tara:strand:+ start:103 stop:390 length:288 start_codon:yes stop_codon:yes gene_type:complete
MWKTLTITFFGISIFVAAVTGSFSVVAQSYTYSVNGYNEDTGKYVDGEVDTYGRDVSGYLVDEEGKEKYFEGEFVSKGVIEGYDEDGNYVTLETD